MSEKKSRVAALREKQLGKVPASRVGQRNIARKFRPDVAFGISAGYDIEDIRIKIGIVIATSFISAILLTISYSQLNDNVSTDIKELLVAAFSISWFLFIGFIFLLFDQTRLLHIMFFISVITIGSIVYGKLADTTDNKISQNLVVAALVFAGAAVIILMFFYFSSMGGEEMIELKTGERIKKRQDEYEEAIKAAKKEGREEILEELGYEKGSKEENVYKLRKELSQIAIENLRKGGGKQQTKKKKSNKKDDDDDDE